MTQMSNAQARVVDPILTTVARGFKQPTLVADRLFPRVTVNARGGNIIQFGREDFEVYNTRRAAGAAARDVTFGYTGLPYALEDHSLNGLVPRETLQEAAAVPGIDKARVALYKVDRIMQLSYELRAAAVARAAANYAASNKTALTAGLRWDVAGTSFPLADVDTAKEAIRSKIGMYPNVMIVPPKPATALKRHATIKGQFNPTSSKTITIDMLTEAFDIPEVIWAPGVTVDRATGLQTDIWGTDVILAYIDVSGLEDMGSPSAFYGYTLDGFPLVSEPYWDNDKRSWKYPYDRCDAPVAAGLDAAYIIQTATN